MQKLGITSKNGHDLSHFPPMELIAAMHTGVMMD